MTRLTGNIVKPYATQNIILFSIVIMLMLCIIIAFLAARTYENAIVKGQHHTERLVGIMSDHTTQTFSSLDQLLRRSLEMQQWNAANRASLDSAKNEIDLWVDELPQVAFVWVLDKNGNEQISAAKDQHSSWRHPLEAAYIPKLLQFMQAKQQRVVIVPSQIFIDRPAQSMIVLGRASYDRNGTINSMALAGVSPDYLLNFFRQIEPNMFNDVTIANLDGSILASSYEQASTEQSRFLLNQVIKQAKPAATSQIRTINDKLKIYSFNRITPLPVAVSVVSSEESFLEDWRNARIKDLGFLGIFTIFVTTVSLFTLAMTRQMIKVQQSEQAAILASQAKSEFLANMSHELRTPLNAINGYSEMISDGYFGPMNEQQKERLQVIHLCGSHLLQLINDILEFSKGSAGKLELVEEAENLGEIVKESTRMMEEKIRSKGVQLILEVSDNLPRLWSDKRKIRQIMLNLLSNAVKFTPRDGTIKVVVKQEANRNLRVIVADTGPGMRREDIPRALSVFGQVHRSHSQEGTGLGLPLSKMFAELHEGTLEIESAPGEGTSIIVTFPASRVIIEPKKS